MTTPRPSSLLAVTLISFVAQCTAVPTSGPAGVVSYQPHEVDGTAEAAEGLEVEHLFLPVNVTPNGTTSIEIFHTRTKVPKKLSSEEVKHCTLSDIQLFEASAQGAATMESDSMAVCIEIGRAAIKNTPWSTGANWQGLCQCLLSMSKAHINVPDCTPSLGAGYTIKQVLFICQEYAIQEEERRELEAAGVELKPVVGPPIDATPAVTSEPQASSPVPEEESSKQTTASAPTGPYTELLLSNGVVAKVYQPVSAHACDLKDICAEPTRALLCVPSACSVDSVTLPRPRRARALAGRPLVHHGALVHPTRGRAGKGERRGACNRVCRREQQPVLGRVRRGNRCRAFRWRRRRYTGNEPERCERL